MIDKKLIKYCTMQYATLLFTVNIYSMKYNNTENFIYNSGIEYSDGLPNIYEHPSNNRSYKCKKCIRTFKTKDGLKQHVIVKHL